MQWKLHIYQTIKEKSDLVADIEEDSLSNLEEEEEEESSVANEDVDEPTVDVVQELNTASMIENTICKWYCFLCISKEKKQPTNEENTIDQHFKYIMMQRQLDHEERRKDQR